MLLNLQPDYASSSQQVQGLLSFSTQKLTNSLPILTPSCLLPASIHRSSSSFHLQMIKSSRCLKWYRMSALLFDRLLLCPFSRCCPTATPTEGNTAEPAILYQQSPLHLLTLPQRRVGARRSYRKSPMQPQHWHLLETAESNWALSTTYSVGPVHPFNLQSLPPTSKIHG